MSGLEFASSLVSSLAWPVAVVVAVFILRRPLTMLLEAPLKRLKVGPTGVEAEWHRTYDSVVSNLPVSAASSTERSSWSTSSDFSDRTRDLAQSSPIGAVVACEQELGQVLRQLLMDAEVAGAEALNVSSLAHRALQEGLINAASANAVEGLVVMHTLALLEDGGLNFSREKAQDYIALTEAVLWTLRQPPK